MYVFLTNTAKVNCSSYSGFWGLLKENKKDRHEKGKSVYKWKRNGVIIRKSTIFFSFFMPPFLILYGKRICYSYYITNVWKMFKENWYKKKGIFMQTYVHTWKKCCFVWMTFFNFVIFGISMYCIFLIQKKQVVKVCK